MSTEKYLKDISEIKNLMNKSSRFISLSGLSGIMAGVYALLGAGLAYWIVKTHSYGTLMLNGWVFKTIVLILVIITILSIITAIYLTTQKAKKNNEKIWDATTKRLLVSFLIPLLAGAIYIIIILNQQRYGQTAALMLLFYGIALVSASKHTIGNVKYLGYIEIILGLFCALFPGFGFWFWVFGFGFMHIVYGSFMHLKLDTK